MQPLYMCGKIWNLQSPRGLFLKLSYEPSCLCCWEPQSTSLGDRLWSSAPVGLSYFCHCLRKPFSVKVKLKVQLWVCIIYVGFWGKSFLFSQTCSVEMVILGSASGDEPACQCRRHKRRSFHPWVGKTPLEEDTATHSSILAWRILWTEEPGGLQSTGSHRVGHNWSDLAHTRVHVVKLS